MSKIFVICNRHDENLLSLYQEGLRLGCEVIPFYHKHLNESFKALYNEISSNDYVMILHTSFGSEHIHNIIRQINCKKFLNKEVFLNEPLIGNKTVQQKLVGLYNSNIIIDTYNKNNIPVNIKIPFIAKPNHGSCGQGIFLIHDILFTQDAPDHYIFQPYIKNDGDWRVIVVGGKSISAIKRLGQIGQTTNNIATGNFAVAETNISVLDEIYPIAESVAKSMNFDYVGIDIIKNIETNKYYFLESNERPTFETSQILTGINISKLILEELISETK